jgi:uncharacterized membrane protein YfcA
MMKDYDSVSDWWQCGSIFIFPGCVMLAPALVCDVVGASLHFQVALCWLQLLFVTWEHLYISMLRYACSSSCLWHCGSIFTFPGCITLAPALVCDVVGAYLHFQVTLRWLQLLFVPLWEHLYISRLRYAGSSSCLWRCGSIFTFPGCVTLAPALVCDIVGASLHFQVALRWLQLLFLTLWEHLYISRLRYPGSSSCLWCGSVMF